jgi:hypothetical protein
MNRCNGRTAVVVAAFLTVAGALALQAQAPAVAPATPPVAARPQDRSQLRRHIYVMEGALARAVSLGAQQLNREIRSVAPEMVVLSGEPQARGVYLEGYGVYFDVGVPILHQSMMWSLRTMLGQDDQDLTEALNTLKAKAKSDPNPTSRAAAENAIMRLELSLGPLAKATGSQAETFPGANRPPAVGAAMISPEAVAAPPTPERQAAPKIDRRSFQDPNAINLEYTKLVQDALIDAMLDWSVPIVIAPDEFLTVAARDNMQRDTLAPLDPSEEVVTILYKIRGADLLAYRKDQISREEIRKRIQILEF